jgi:hypothetical protein
MTCERILKLAIATMAVYALFAYTPLKRRDTKMYLRVDLTRGSVLCSLLPISLM